MTILVKAVAGSHLFGTNTEKSDKDYKGIYLPSGYEILLGGYPETISNSTGDSQSKNSSTDVDIELYSLKKFLKMVANGDTSAIELLYTPDYLIIEQSEDWKEIREEAKKLINKNLSAMIGYCRSQVNRYGIRGSRMSDLEIVVKGLKKLDKLNPHMKMKVCWDEIKELIKDLSHCNLIILQNSEEGIEVLGKKFGFHTKIEVVCKSLSDLLETYGHRSREAKENKGLDYKAISHALRVCIQAKELLLTGGITLPHVGENLDSIMNMKLGNTNFLEFDKELNDRLVEIEQLIKTSSLPETFDEDLLEDIIIKYHMKQLTY